VKVAPLAVVNIVSAPSGCAAGWAAAALAKAITRARAANEGWGERMFVPSCAR